MDVSAYELLSTAVLLLDRRGIVNYANTAAEELFGRPHGQIARRLAFGSDPPRPHSQLLFDRLGRPAAVDVGEFVVGKHLVG